MAIYGNPITLGGGSLKATDALLRVQAPAGSTVTISKGTTTKTDLGHENADDNSVYDYYFIIHQSQFDSVNAWTVTATLTESGETQTASDTIIIDTADEYDVELSYRFYLYNLGDEISALTGGYSSNHNGNGTNTFAKNASNMTLYSKSTGGACNICCYAANAIDLTDYSTLEMLCDLESTRISTDSVSIGVRTTAPTGGGYSGTYLATSDLGAVGTDQIITLDVSAINQAVYIVARQWVSSSGSTQTLTVKQIWLRK